MMTHDSVPPGSKGLPKSWAALQLWIRKIVRREQLRIVPAPDGIWHYRAGRWSFRAVPGVTGHWVHLAADPNNPDHWWLTTEQPSRFIETFDAGLTWADIAEIG